MSARSDLDGSTSICVDPQYAPIGYHWFRVLPHRRLIDEVREVVAQVAMPPVDRDRLIGDFTGRMLMLVRGDLRPRVHIKGPMQSVTHLEVFEVRAGVSFGEDSRAELRAYHVEPRQLTRTGGSIVVGLHVHEKDLSEGVDVGAAQDRQIDVAVARYFAGKDGWWGGVSLPST